VGGAIGLLAMWLALWGDATVGNLVGGAAVVALVYALFPARVPDRNHRVHPIALGMLVVRMTGRLARSSVAVALTVIRPTPERLRSGIVRVPLSQGSPLIATIMSQLIGMTPGTVVVDVDEAPDARDTIVLYVHVMGVDELDDFRQQIRSLEREVLDAVEPVPLHGKVTT
jgi:multicomponent Na+:H+ antiporter subunit E